LPFSAFGSPYEGKIDYEIASRRRLGSAEPKDSIKFAVLHTDDNEIFTITAALQRGRREIVSVHSTEPGGNQNPRNASAQLKPEPIEERRAGRMI